MIRLRFLPLALALLLLQAAPSAVAWDHLDRSHPSRRTIWSFRWTKPFLNVDGPGPGSENDPKDGGRDIPGGFQVSCQETRSFAARQYTVADLHKPYPAGLEPWAGMVDIVLNQRVYPGGWEGDDLEGDDKTVLLMEYKDVPLSVRLFVEQESMDAYTAKRWLFGVYDKPRRPQMRGEWATAHPGEHQEETVHVEERPATVEEKVMIFAPGALYDILPLWVADESSCKKYFRDLEKYVPHAAHDKVIAWPMSHSEPDPKRASKDVTFEIRAARVLETVQGRRHREAWEAIHKQASRAERRLQRLEREAGKGRYRLHGSEHDEL